MSTGNTPNPPDRPTNIAPKDEGQASEQAAPADTATQAPFDLADDLARVISEQADVLAQRLVYHTQTLFGVGAMSVDVVNARNSVMVFANALRNKSEQLAVGTLAMLGTGQNAQINDGTLPFKNNSQVAGAISVSGPVHRYLPDKVPEIAVQVAASAAAISRKLGFARGK